VFIDDRYVGDYDKLNELNENEKLDSYLKMETVASQLVTEVCVVCCILCVCACVVLEGSLMLVVALQEEHLARLKLMPSK